MTDEQPERPVLAAYRSQRLLIRALERIGFKPAGGVSTSLNARGQFVIQLLPGVGERLAAWLDGLSSHDDPKADAEQPGQGEVALTGPVEHFRPEATEE